MEEGSSRFLSGSNKDATVQGKYITSEEVNAAISIADDGRTCIFCDSPFKNPPEYIVLDMLTFKVHIVGGDFGPEGVCLQYPLEYDKMSIWKNEKVTYFAHVDEDGADNMYEVDVAFVNEK